MYYYLVNYEEDDNRYITRWCGNVNGTTTTTKQQIRVSPTPSQQTGGTGFIDCLKDVFCGNSTPAQPNNNTVLLNNSNNNNNTPTTISNTASDN